MRRKLAAGNWKMNGTGDSLTEIEALAAAYPAPGVDILICPPATLIGRAAGKGIALGGQDCHAATNGAHTGNLSADMLRDAGATSVIVGHSERRTDHGETDATVCAKAQAGLAAGLDVIICVGETLAEREAGQTLDVIATQMDGSIPDGIDGARVVLAYEPVWAIGTGLVPDTAQIAEVHSAMRARLTDRFGADTGDAVRLLYGGSVKPGNAAEIFAVADVDGALVGGASLKAADFGGIIDALEAGA
ncbi:MAG: triose-phosphate isomerase [Marinibacterium sp.]|nr:triose-phosphate isomerase [Marinibacterium sp.]